MTRDIDPAAERIAVPRLARAEPRAGRFRPTRLTFSETLNDHAEYEDR
jgi:hypothetical protein